MVLAAGPHGTLIVRRCVGSEMLVRERGEGYMSCTREYRAKFLLSSADVSTGCFIIQPRFS